MKSRTTELSIIAAALVAILGSGFGLGSAFAPRKLTPPQAKPREVPMGDFEKIAFSNLQAALNLTPDQEAAIHSELSETSDRIREARCEALLKYHLHLLDLHDTIDPKLDPEQQETLRKNKRLLQDTIESSFKKSLDELRSSIEDES